MDKAEGAVKVAKHGGQPIARQEAVKSAPDQKKGYLFLMVEILRLREVGEFRERIIRNLGKDSRLTSAIYDICEKRPDLDARQILKLLLEQISFQREHLPVDGAQWDTHIPAKDMSWNTPAQRVRIEMTV